MSGPRFRRLELWTNAQCAGGVCLGAYANLLALETEDVLSAEATLSAAIAVTDAMAGSTIPRYVVRLILTDGAFFEYRIVEVVTQTGGGEYTLTFTAQSLLFDMADMVLTTTVSPSAGTTVSGGAATGITLSSLLTLHVLPYCAATLPWVGLGTIEPTRTADYQWGMSTPLALLQQGVAETEGELQWRRNGTSGYLIDVLTERNGAMAPLVVRTGRNLYQLRRRLSAREQANVIVGVPSHGTFGLEHVRWKVQANNTGLKRLTLTGRDGGEGPILEDGQFVGWTLWRVTPPRPYTIVNTYAASQQVELADTTYWTVGEECEFRVNATDGVAILPSTLRGTVNRNLLRVSAVTGATITVQEPVANADPITTDDEYNDYDVRVSQEIATGVAITQVTTVGEQLRLLASTVTGLAVGDWGVAYTSATVPWATGGGGICMQIDSIDTVNKYLFVRARHPYTNNVTSLLTTHRLTLPAGTTQTRWFRERGITRRVTDTVAASNDLVLPSGTGIAVSDVLEVCITVGGRLPTALSRTGAVAAYGQRIGIFAADGQNGLSVLNDNPFVSTWTTPASAPDGWTKTGTGTLTRVTALVRYGSYAAEMSGTSSVTLATPVFRPCGGVGGAVPVTASLFFYASAGWDTDTNANVLLEFVRGGTSTQIASVRVQGAARTGTDTVLAAGVWNTVNLNIAEYSTIQALFSEGVQVRVTYPGSTVAPYTVTVDGILVAYGAQEPPEPRLSAYGDALTLWRRVQAKLAELGTPVATYELDTVDIARVDSDVTPEVGMPVWLIDPASATNTNNERLVRIRRNWLVDGDIRLTVATRQRKLSMMLGGASISGTALGFGGTL